MQDAGGSKRLREEKCPLSGKPGLRTETADLRMDEASLIALALMREARRSDNSDTFPTPENIDEESPEVPAGRVVPGQKPCAYQYTPTIINRQRTGSWSGKPVPVPAARSATSLRGLGSLSELELHHQLIQLDIVEQELLGELRQSRREYDARALQLAGGLCATGQMKVDPSPGGLNTQFLQRGGAIQPPSRPQAFTIAQTDANHITASAGCDAAAASSSAFHGAMLPPPPRARRGSGQPNVDRDSSGPKRKCLPKKMPLPAPPPAHPPQDWIPSNY